MSHSPVSRVSHGGKIIIRPVHCRFLLYCTAFYQIRNAPFSRRCPEDHASPPDPEPSDDGRISGRALVVPRRRAGRRHPEGDPRLYFSAQPGVHRPEHQLRAGADRSDYRAESASKISDGGASRLTQRRSKSLSFSITVQSFRYKASNLGT